MPSTGRFTQGGKLGIGRGQQGSGFAISRIAERRMDRVGRTFSAAEKFESTDPAVVS
jgi:hypothetical protein